MTFRYIAWQNVRRQWRDYAAYLFATGFSVMVFFVFVSLYYHPQFNELAASNLRMRGLFVVSAILVGVFSIIFLWYSSSLFFHKRNREVGTWMLLGMKKREAAWILYLESFIVGILALAAGIGLGLLLRRLFLLLLVRMMSLPMELELQVDARPLAVTAAAFIALFATTGLSGVIGVLRYDLVRLFHDEQTGEERPRFVIVQALLAAVAIGIAYYLAAWPGESVGLGTLGLILIVTIVGTFLLFGGVGYLAVRAQKRRLASRAEPLGTVSAGQVLFRIRRNAKFLALVAVLNAVAITAVGTFLTFREERDMLFGSLATTAPFDFSFVADSPEFLEEIEELARRTDPKQAPRGAFVRVIIPSENLPYSPVGSVDALMSQTSYSELAALSKLPALPQTRIGAQEVVLVARTGAEAHRIEGNDVSGLPDGRMLRIVDVVNANVFSYDRVPGGYTGVVSDRTFEELRETWPEELSSEIVGVGVLDVAESTSAWRVLEALDEALPPEAGLAGSAAYMIVVNSVTGVLLFIGAFIGVMLVLSNGSVIFFRQLMEAHESRGRFELLSKLGFTRRDIRRTIIRGQISLFGVPYLVGLVHALFALIMLASLINISTIDAHIAISAVYAVVYVGYIAVNVRVYERIVMPPERGA